MDMVWRARLDGDALERRCIEVVDRLTQGATIAELANDYGVARTTVWRWKNQGLRNHLPEMGDRDQVRRELATTLMSRVVELSEGADDRALVQLSDRLAKLLGLDHRDMLADELVRIEAAKVDLVLAAIQQAADAAGLTGRDRDTLIGQFITEVGKLEDSTSNRREHLVIES